MPASIEIRALGPGDDVLVREAAELFDDTPIEGATARFLAEPGHHLLVAYEQGEPAGFAAAFFVAAKDVSFGYPARRDTDTRGAGTHGWTGSRALRVLSHLITRAPCNGCCLAGNPV